MPSLPTKYFSQPLNLEVFTYIDNPIKINKNGEVQEE